jgi:hypothetical protein
MPQTVIAFPGTESGVVFRHNRFADVSILRQQEGSSNSLIKHIGECWYICYYAWNTFLSATLRFGHVDSTTLERGTEVEHLEGPK